MTSRWNLSHSLFSARSFLLLSTMLVLAVQTVWFVRSANIRGFATGDGGVKLWQVQGILRSGDLNAPLSYPGVIYDPDHTYTPLIAPWGIWYQGKPYTEYISPFVWASTPLFAAFGHAGLMLLPWLSGMLLIIMSAWLAWRVRPDRSAALVPLIVGFGSPLLVYSLEFWEHTPGTALTVFALVAIVKAMNSRRRAAWLILAGAAIGLSLTMRAELYVYPIAMVIGLIFIRPILPVIRSSMWLALGGLITAGPWWLYQSITWGNPLGPRLQENVPALGGTEMLARLGDTTGRNWAMLWPADNGGLTLLAVLVAALVLVALLSFGLRRRTARIQDFGFWIGVVLIMLIAVTVIGHLAQGQRPDDLLSTFPIILLLILPAPHTALSGESQPIAGRSSAITTIRFLTSVTISFVILVLLMSPFHGGIQWGPRFLLPIVPPLTVVLIDRVAGLWGRLQPSARAGWAVALSVLLVAGSYSTWLGVQFMQQGQISSEFMSEMIRNMPERVVVADAWFLPQMAAYTYSDKIWLMAEDDRSMFQLLQHLRKQTNEPGFIYTSALSWAHIDPQASMGPRLAPVEGFEKIHVDAPTQYIEISRFQLLK